MIEIEQADSAAAVEAARGLFREYQAAIGVDLCFQGFATEVETLPGDYAPPGGRLLLAYDGDAVAGCVGLRRLTEDAGEMKRLYVRPSFRNAGVGQRLVERVIGEARTVGYQRIYLDTLLVMAAAQRMYQRLGFKETSPYRDNLLEGARFLVLGL